MLTSVVDQLERYSDRTFSYAEMKFFKMWWQRQSEARKKSVRKLIKAGQLNIVNGGLSAPDEATTSHDDLLDNFMSGHRFIKEELQSEEPTISWQVDSFGESRGYARLARDIGFDAMFYSRVDAKAKLENFEKKQKLGVWRPAEDNFGA